jgi:hypothetical protein
MNQETEKTFSRKEVRNAFNEAKMLTNDQVQNVLATLTKRGDFTEQQQRVLSTTLEALIADSMSRVMSNKGL